MDNKLTVEQLMAAPFQTGQVSVNFSQNRVVLNGEALVLQPKVLELLLLLCAAHGETLSKQQLTDALWPDTVVGPDSLANSITRLRRALKDDAKNPAFIETVQRKGYRWLPNVECAQVNQSKMTATKYLAMAATVIVVGLIWFLLLRPEPQPEKFPFPDLRIQKLEDGGYEIDVGIEGELTEEKKAAMLKELKRITGEENSDMEFTVDPVKPGCGPAKKEHKDNPDCK